MKWLIPFLIITSAQAEKYWIQKYPALPVDAVFVVQNIYAFCGTQVYGCTVRRYDTATIYLDRDAPDLNCVESHERKHAAGYEHHDRPHNQLIC